MLGPPFVIWFFPEAMAGVGGRHNGPHQGEGCQAWELPEGQQNTATDLNRPIQSDHRRGVHPTFREGRRLSLNLFGVSARISDCTPTFSNEDRRQERSGNSPRKSHESVIPPLAHAPHRAAETTHHGLDRWSKIRSSSQGPQGGCRNGQISASRCCSCTLASPGWNAFIDFVVEGGDVPPTQPSPDSFGDASVGLTCVMALGDSLWDVEVAVFGLCRSDDGHRQIDAGGNGCTCRV